MEDYGCVKLELPFVLKTVNRLEISWQADDHVRLVLSGLAEVESAEAWGKEGTDFTVRLYAKGEKTDELLFHGILESARFRREEGMEALLYAAGSTVLLDIEKKSRSFQRSPMEYEGLFREIMAETGGDFMIREHREKPVRSPFIQYEETDWEFMKRLAACYGSHLYACAGGALPQFYLGMGKGGEGGEISDAVHFDKQVGEYLKFRRRGEAAEQSFLTCKVKSCKRYEIGDGILCSGIRFRIGGLCAVMEKAELEYEYTLVQEPGPPVTVRNNELFRGRRVTGRVIETGEGRARLHLALDDSQKREAAYWYPVKRGDWYCMPEKGSLAALVFPSADESEAYVEGFCGQEGFKEMQRPEEKRMLVPGGQEMEVTPEAFRLKAGGGGLMLELSDAKGIRVTGRKRIRLETEGDFCCRTGSFDVESRERIVLQTDKTAIVMDETVQLKG